MDAFSAAPPLRSISMPTDDGRRDRRHLKKEEKIRAHKRDEAKRPSPAAVGRREEERWPAVSAAVMECAVDHGCSSCRGQRRLVCYPSRKTARSTDGGRCGVVCDPSSFPTSSVEFSSLKPPPYSSSSFSSCTFSSAYATNSSTYSSTLPSTSTSQTLSAKSALLLIVVGVLAITSCGHAKTCVVPRFTKLPPALVFRTASYPSASPQLTCSAYPASTRVVFLQRRPPEGFPTTVSQAESRGSATYRVEGAALHSDSDFYCRLGTEFGHLLSRPFRIVKAEIRGYSHKEPSLVESFYKGNIAQVRCSIPRSQPPAKVQFLKDGVVVGHSDKYLEARRPGGSWVALLIKEFSSNDIGNYSCKARNPVSLQEVESRAKTTLTLRKASSAFSVRFHKAYPYHKAHQKVTVREGDNVTLYCLPEGAPIPSVKWFRQSGTSGGLPKSTTRFPDFGAIRIDNVQPEHASTYSCSVRQGDIMLNRAFELIVQQRLKIIKPPQDLKIARVGSVAELSCEASGGEGAISIQWYFNAQPINVNLDANYAVDGTVLKVMRVTTDLLGIYQCVATTTNEWASASAAIALKGDVIQRGNDRPKYRTAVVAAESTAILTCPMNKEEESMYTVTWFKDNKPLFADKKSRFMSNHIPPSTFMNILMAEEGDAGIYTCRYYNKRSSALVKEDSVKLIISDTPPPAPDGPKASEKTWTPPGKPKGPGGCTPGDPNCPPRPKEPTGGPSRPRTGGGKRRLTNAPPPPPVDSSDEVDAVEADGLSPPHLTMLFDNLAVTLSWNYTGPADIDYYAVQYRYRDTRPKHTLANVPGHSWSKATALASAQMLKFYQTKFTIVGQPLTPGYSYRFRVIAKLKPPDSKKIRSKWSKEADFSYIFGQKPELKPPYVISPNEVKVSWGFDGTPGMPEMDEFVINYRIRINHDEMEGYQARVVKGGHTREVVIDKLLPNTVYQFVVYGVLQPTTPAQRRITLFSNPEEARTPPCTEPMFCALGTTALPADQLDPSRKAETNRETFLILGGLAAFLIVVLVILMALCLWKQRRDKRRMRATALQATLNGTNIDSNYKNAKFFIPGTNSASSQLLLANLGDGTTTAWQQHQQHQHQHHQQQLLQQRFIPTTNGGLRLNVNPEAASLLNCDERFAALPPPPTLAAGYYGNGTLRRDSRHDKIDAESLCAARMADDPLYATRLHPAYAVTSPIGLGYPLPHLPPPLGGPPGHFSPYAVAAPMGTIGCDGAESVYSYFSQQEAGTQHHDHGPGQPMGPSRTVDRPRHHRRKRRRPTHTTCSQSGLESGSETGAPQTKDMAVNTDMSSSDAVYESSLQASTTASPPPRMGALMMGSGVPVACSTPSAYKSPPGGPEMPTLPPLSTPVTSVASSSASSGPPGCHTLSRRTPNLFLDPPRVRDYTEYGVAVSPGPGGVKA